MPAEESTPLESLQQNRAGSGKLLVDRLDRFAVWVGFGSDQQHQQELDRESEAAKAGAGTSDVGGGAVAPSAEAVVVVPKVFEASERRHLLAEDSCESSADRGAGTSDRNRRPPTPTPVPPQPPAVAAAAAAVPATEDGPRFDGTYSESVRSAAESSVDSFESADGLLFPDGSAGDLGLFADTEEAFSAVEVETAGAEEGAGEFMSIRLGEGSTEG